MYLFIMCSNKIELVLEAISLHFDAGDLKSRLYRTSAVEVIAWKDRNSLDLIHHCILENNMVALVLILNKGYFKSPYEPSTWPYLHLVACLGHRAFISSIVQELKFQNDAVHLDWSVYKKVIEPKQTKTHVSSLRVEDKEEILSPVDVAALFGHSGCVRLLLDFWQVQPQNIGRRKSRTTDATATLYLSLACKVNSPKALRLLMSEHSDVKEALECSLRMVVPECVDIVLREGNTATVSQAFNGMNLFHVLYSYTTFLHSEQYEAMVQLTTILIRHNQDVNACKPSRTFPLYSLLSHRGSLNAVEEISPFLIASLLMLLKAGANPNFDEIYLEKREKNSRERSAFGRYPFSSAVNCMLITLSYLKLDATLNNIDTNPIDNYAYKCVELLLRHGADLNNFGEFVSNFQHGLVPTEMYHRGSALHVYLSTRPMSLLSYPLLRLLMRYGIDANMKGFYQQYLNKGRETEYEMFETESICLQYAINIIPFSIWTQPLRESAEVLKKCDLKNFSYISRFMSQTSLTLAFQEFTEQTGVLKESMKNKEEINKLVSTHLDGSAIYQEFLNMFEIGTRQPWLLQRLSSYVIWRACRLHMGNIFSLPIPGPLRDVILNFF